MSSSRASAPPPPAALPRLPLPTALLRPCCLRCAKHLSRKPDLVCRRPTQHSKCSRCAQLGKKCDPVSPPPEDTTACYLAQIPPRFNRLFAGCQQTAEAYNAAAADARAPLAGRLRSKVKSFRRRVESYLRRVENYLRRVGAAAASQRTEDAMLVATQRVADSLDEIVDVMRFMVCNDRIFCTAIA